MWPIPWSLKLVRSACKRPTKHIPQHLTERDFRVCISVAHTVTCYLQRRREINFWSVAIHVGRKRRRLFDCTFMQSTGGPWNMSYISKSNLIVVVVVGFRTEKSGAI
jgi:hypothetical protein